MPATRYTGPGSLGAAIAARQMQATAPAPQPQGQPRVIGELTGSVQPDQSDAISDHGQRIAQLEQLAHSHAEHIPLPDNPGAQQ